MTELIAKGGPIMVVIIALSVFTATLIIERWIFLFVNRTRKGFLNRFFLLVKERKAREAYNLCKKTRGPVSEVLSVCLINYKVGKERMRESVSEVVARERPKLERYLSTIAVMGTIMPILGLLGTVTGMIQTFDVISVIGTGDPEALAGGISMALITTQAGLVVAIPIIILHNILSNKVERIMAEMEEVAKRFINLL
jgi:biopolymer transport protein ExbB